MRLLREDAASDGRKGVARASQTYQYHKTKQLKARCRVLPEEAMNERWRAELSTSLEEFILTWVDVQ